MGFPITGESLRDSASKGLARAIHAMTRPEEGSADPYDELMQVWAIVELVGPSLGDGFVKYERESMQRLAEKLDQPARDAASASMARKLARANPDLAAECKKLAKRFGKQPTQPVALQRGRRLNPMAYRLVAELAEARARAERWPIKPSDPSDDKLLATGLAQTYRNVRRRNRLKTWAPRHLGDQLRLVEPGWPSAVKPLRKTALALAEEAHKMRAAEALRAAAGARSPVGIAVREMMTEIEQGTQKRVDRLLVETPAAFAKRLTGYATLQADAE